MADSPITTNDAWFRSDAWDAPAREAFESGLARTRSSRVHAQFLRIKSIALVESRDAARVEAGRGLLARILEEHADNALEVAGAHRILAESFVLAGRLDLAEKHLRAGLDVERDRSFGHANELRLAAILLSQDHTDLDEAHELLEAADQSRGSMLDNDAWRIAVARARLHHRQGDHAAASQHATAALRLFSDDRPQPARHQDVGPIAADPATVAEMKQLANNR